jgi:Ca-activated chloride channel family protein
MIRVLTALCALSLLCGRPVAADTGVIVPSDRQSPDASILAIESMDVHIDIDNGHATVTLREIFRNKTGKTLEGTYSLALPGDAAVSDFAVWDDLTRIPGVILERKRASELYDQIRNEAIDPGLLQSGEVTESGAPGEAKHSTEFTVKIVPIQAYGYKRIEAAYRQNVPVTQLASDFVFPLKPSAGESVTVANFSLSVEIRSTHAIADFQGVSTNYPLTVSKRTPEAVSGSFTQRDLTLNQDFEVKYRLTNDKLPRVTTYRDASRGEPGYFEASAILQPPVASGNPSTGPARTVLVLFDTSLSMQWDKLERSFQALEATLRSLQPTDRFNVLVFNSEVSPAAAAPIPATADAIAEALDFVRASKLRGGTNLQSAFKSAFAQCTSDSYLVLLSDGDMTEGTIAPARLSSWFDATWSGLPAEHRPHVYTFAIGDDANRRFMQRLASHGGVFEQIGSTEPVEFKLGNFVREIGLAPLDAVNLSIAPRAIANNVYRLRQDDFPGTLAAWVGEYGGPGKANFTLTTGIRRSKTSESVSAQLPAVDTADPYLPATWARARVDALLEKIDREGEDKSSIDEIIRLSRQYHFVTPYTSFLAAPRALLRPRLIRPGDPLLRVRTDPSISSVIALFPFGLTKPLRYLPREDIWQTRFLAPADLADGAHVVRLILRDRAGHVYSEQKTFVISSKPPLVQVHLNSYTARPGDRLKMRVQASATTRSITARLYGAEPVSLRWSELQKSSTGVLVIPASLPPGRYSIHVTAEDIAHNVSHQEVALEILP